MTYTSLRRTIDPADRAVSVAELRAYLRIDTQAEDTLLEQLLDWAIDECEQAGLVPVTSTWLWCPDAWPPGYPGPDYLRVPLAPLQAVAQIQYYDEANTLQTLAASNYLVDGARKAGIISLAPDGAWPSLAARAGAIQITLTAGYGLAAAVPAGLKLWLMRVAGLGYRDRESAVIPLATMMQLDTFRPIDRPHC